MPVKPIPDGYHTVTPYLVVGGVARLLEFLAKAFDAKERHRMLRPDGSVQHAEVQIGDSRVMMGEASAEFPPQPACIYLYVADCDAYYQRALAAEGTSMREPADMPYGDRNGGVKDPSGNTWWISTQTE
jgi:PhnB protein